MNKYIDLLEKSKELQSTEYDAVQNGNYFRKVISSIEDEKVQYAFRPNAELGKVFLLGERPFPELFNPNDCGFDSKCRLVGEIPWDATLKALGVTGEMLSPNEDKVCMMSDAPYGPDPGAFTLIPESLSRDDLIRIQGVGKSMSPGPRTSTFFATFGASVKTCADRWHVVPYVACVVMSMMLALHVWRKRYPNAGAQSVATRFGSMAVPYIVNIDGVRGGGKMTMKSTTSLTTHYKGEPMTPSLRALTMFIQLNMLTTNVALGQMFDPVPWDAFGRALFVRCCMVHKYGKKVAGALVPYVSLPLVYKDMPNFNTDHPTSVSPHLPHSNVNYTPFVKEATDYVRQLTDLLKLDPEIVAALAFCPPDKVAAKKMATCAFIKEQSPFTRANLVPQPDSLTIPKLPVDVCELIATCRLSYGYMLNPVDQELSRPDVMRKSKNLGQTFTLWSLMQQSASPLRIMPYAKPGKSAGWDAVHLVFIPIQTEKGKGVALVPRDSEFAGHALSEDEMMEMFPNIRDTARAMLQVGVEPSQIVKSTIPSTKKAPMVLATSTIYAAFDVDFISMFKYGRPGTRTQQARHQRIIFMLRIAMSLITAMLSDRITVNLRDDERVFLGSDTGELIPVHGAMASSTSPVGIAPLSSDFSSFDIHCDCQFTISYGLALKDTFTSREDTRTRFICKAGFCWSVLKMIQALLLCNDNMPYLVRGYSEKYKQLTVVSLTLRDPTVEAPPPVSLVKVKSRKKPPFPPLQLGHLPSGVPGTALRGTGGNIGANSIMLRHTMIAATGRDWPIALYGVQRTSFEFRKADVIRWLDEKIKGKDLIADEDPETLVLVKRSLDDPRNQPRDVVLACFHNSVHQGDDLLHNLQVDLNYTCPYKTTVILAIAVILSFCSRYAGHEINVTKGVIGPYSASFLKVTKVCGAIIGGPLPHFVSESQIAYPFATNYSRVVRLICGSIARGADHLAAFGMLANFFVAVAVVVYEDKPRAIDYLKTIMARGVGDRVVRRTRVIPARGKFPEKRVDKLYHYWPVEEIVRTFRVNPLVILSDPSAATEGLLAVALGRLRVGAPVPHGTEYVADILKHKRYGRRRFEPYARSGLVPMGRPDVVLQDMKRSIVSLETREFYEHYKAHKDDENGIYPYLKGLWAYEYPDSLFSQLADSLSPAVGVEDILPPLISAEPVFGVDKIDFASLNEFPQTKDYRNLFAFRVLDYFDRDVAIAVGRMAGHVPNGLPKQSSPYLNSPIPGALERYLMFLEKLPRRLATQENKEFALRAIGFTKSNSSLLQLELALLIKTPATKFGSPQGYTSSLLNLVSSSWRMSGLDVVNFLHSLTWILSEPLRV